MKRSSLLQTKDGTNISKVRNFIHIIFICTSKHEKLLLIAAIIFAIFTGMIQPFGSYTLGEVSQVLVTITNAINNKTITPSDLENAYQTFEHDMNRVCLYFFLCGAAYFIFGFLQFSLMKYVGDNTTYRLRKRLISCLLQKDIQYFDSHSTGSFSTLLNDNLERFREVFNEKMTLILDYLIDFSVGTTLAFYTDWKLASYGFIFAMGVGFSGLINSSNMMKTTVKQNQHYNNAGSIVFQTLGSFKTVCSLNGQKTELEKYSKELITGEKYGIRRVFLNSLSRGLDFFFSNALNAVMLYFGANMIYDKTLQPAVVIRVYNFMFFGSICLSEAISMTSRLSSAISSIAPIAEIIINDNIEDGEESVDNGNIEDLVGKIIFRDVHFSYPSRPDVEVLKGISFDVNHGECVAIVGASGSGKSTVVQLLLHYYNIESGSILIDGRDLSCFDLKQLRKVIGVVSQEPVLFNTTIEENIRFGNPNSTISEICDALKKANAYEFVCAFPKGIKTIVGERGTQLSGGQKQRIAIARTLIRNPLILLLDEATSALDNGSERVVQSALENASRGRTTIVIAHRLSTIRNASKIIVMDKGQDFAVGLHMSQIKTPVFSQNRIGILLKRITYVQIVEIGNHEELIAKNGVYHNLVHTQLDLCDASSEGALLTRQQSEAGSVQTSDAISIDDSEDDMETHDDMKRLIIIFID